MYRRTVLCTRARGIFFSLQVPRYSLKNKTLFNSRLLLSKRYAFAAGKKQGFNVVLTFPLYLSRLCVSQRSRGANDFFRHISIRMGNERISVILPIIFSPVISSPTALIAAFIEEGYHSTNPYHNSIHATDVTQAMHCFLQEKKVIFTTSSFSASGHERGFPTIQRAPLGDAE